MSWPWLISFLVPLSVIALAIPLMLEKIPRNHFYGVRTRQTLSSNEIWYYANRICGYAMIAAGLFWLALVHILHPLLHNDRAALNMAALGGALGLGVACAVPLILTRRKFPA